MNANSRIIPETQYKKAVTHEAQISPSVLMIQTSGLRQHVASHSRYNLTEPDPLKVCLFVFPKNFLVNVWKIPTAACRECL
jgi:hypothetical protein